MSKSINYAYPKVSVIIPCRNEKSYITSCVKSIIDNNYPGELEIIIVDGMSDDGTREILSKLASQYHFLRILDNPSKMTPTAMNIGLRVAKGDIIIIVGAHCEISSEYIIKTVKRLLVDKKAGCVGGRTFPKANGNLMQEAIAAVLESRFGVGNSYFRLPGKKVREVDTVAFGAYPREIFTKVGFFDERLVRNQDIEFNFRVRKAGYKILLDPSVEVYYKPRRTLKAFLKQNFSNGLWNILTWSLVPGSLSWRHFVPLLFVSFIIILGLSSIFNPFFYSLFILLIGLYMLADVLETIRLVFKKQKPILLTTFFIFPVLHIGYGLGSLYGALSLLLKKLN